jgi:hypothetical protein
MTALDLFALAGMASIPTCIGLGMAWWNARTELRVRRELTRGWPEPPPRRDTSTDTQRLEEAIDAIALEVERIAEGQRFVARLMAERAESERALPPSSSPPRVITPH